MAAISDKQAIRFVNEQVRPMCERVRALIAEIDSMQVDWFQGLNALFPNDSSSVDDGREGEGISRLTGADINNVMTILGAIAGEKNEQIIGKPCVRALTAS